MFRCFSCSRASRMSLRMALLLGGAQILFALIASGAL